MADTKLAVVPQPTTIGATIKALLQSHQALRKAAAELEQLGRAQLDAGVYAFAAVPPKPDVLAFARDAFKASVEQKEKKATLDAEAAALVYWAGEVDARLAGLAEHFSDDVVRALDAELALLEAQQLAEQGQVDEVEAVIADFEALRALLLKTGAATGSKPSGKAAKRS